MSLSKRIVASLLTVSLAAATLLSGCTSQKPPAAPGPGGEEPAGLGLIEEGKLYVGSDCDYPPFIWLEEGKPVGFEYDLMKAIAEDLGLELVYLEPQNFDSLPTALAGGGKMDLAVSSLTITDERLEVINFCTPYMVSNQAIVTKATSSYTSYADLAELVIGAQAGTTGLDWAIENLPDATIKEYNQTSDGLAALRAGEIEALIFDEPVAAWQVQFGYTDCKIMEVIATGELYGFAVSKDNPALEAAVNASLKKLIDDGAYAILFEEYFNFEPTLR